MNIRPYTGNDKAGCIELFKSNMPILFDPAELPEYEEWLDTELNETQADAEQQYLVAERNGKLIACGGYYIDLKKRESVMTFGMVDNSLHRQGIGRDLLVYRINKILSICPDCLLKLDTSQYSYAFFEKMGFEVKSVTKNFYVGKIDKYEMELKRQ